MNEGLRIGVFLALAVIAVVVLTLSVAMADAPDLDGPTDNNAGTCHDPLCGGLSPKQIIARAFIGLVAGVLTMIGCATLGLRGSGRWFWPTVGLGFALFLLYLFALLGRPALRESGMLLGLPA